MTATFLLTEVSVQQAPTATFLLTELSVVTATVPTFLLTELSVVVASSGSAPTVVASADQEVSAGADVQLSCSAVGSGGGAITYVWRPISRSAGAPVVTLSSTTDQSPTLVAPSLAAGATYVFGVTSFQGGLPSAESPTTISVDPADFIYPNPATGMWDRAGTDLQPTATGWA